MCEPRIYVACLASYNNGILHGKWIDAAQSADGIYEEVAGMLETSPIADAEEWAIHDYEGFGAYRLSEYEGFESVSEIAEFIEEHEELGVELLAYFSDVDEARTAIDEQYAGCYDSLADFAEELTEGSMDVPERLRFYIDFERMGRDMEMGGDICTFEIGCRVHVFWSN
ncbi:antirestriction protein ArdA [Ketobacter sp.]